MDANNLNYLVERYEELTFLIHKRGETLINHELSNDLTHDQHIALRFIHKNQSTTSTELADFLSVNKSAVTALINRLEEKQLIQRERQTKDRRVINLSLSIKGIELFDQCEQKINDLVSQLIKRFDDEEIKQFMNTYEKLAQFMDEALKENN